MDSRASLFGDLIRTCREEAGLALKELAARLDKVGYRITLDAISKYERGLRRPGGDFIYYLGKCFNWDDEEVEDALNALSSDYLEELTDQYYEVQKWQKK